LRGQAERFRDLLIHLYGKTKGAKIEFAEAFEPCEYGSPLDNAARKRLFPFIEAR
jgi:N-acetylglucosamine malate deacetylase 1